MDYLFELAMSNTHNVLTALAQGGALTCEEIAERVWAAAPPAVRNAKIQRPGNPARRTEDYAKYQIRQEVRRTLNSYYSDEEDTWVHRATPVGSSEIFWITELYDQVEPTLEERLVAANSVSGMCTSSILQECLGNSRRQDGRVSFISVNLSNEMADILTEVFADEFEGQQANEDAMNRLRGRLEEIICNLQDMGE